jgi:hypothetical protein
MPPSESQRVRLRNALVILGGLAMLTAPFAWSVYASYRDYRDYVFTTLEEPRERPSWSRRSLTSDDCVSEALAWIAPCPGFEELCQQALAEVVGRCLASRDRRAWCQTRSDALKRASYGLGACQEHLQTGKLADTALNRQRCSVGYRAVADWCEAQPPPRRAQVDIAPEPE